MKPNQLNEDLLQIVQVGPVSAVRQLVEDLGVDVNINDQLGNTPLMLASKNKQPEIVNYLIKAGATINVANIHGMTPLMFAAEDGQLEIVKALLDAKAEVDQVSPYKTPNPLSLAAGNKHIPVLQTLLLAGANINSATSTGHTALMSAVFSEDVNTVSFLLESGADSEMKNWEGDTALNMAEDNNFRDIFKSLLSVSPNLNTILNEAILDANIDRVKILLTLKINLNIPDKNGVTAMGHALAAKQYKFILLFLNYKAKTLYTEFKAHPSYYILSGATRLALGALVGYGMLYSLTAIAAPYLAPTMGALFTSFLPNAIAVASTFGGMFASIKLANSLLTRFFGETKIIARIFSKQGASEKYEAQFAHTTKKGILVLFGQHRPYINKSVSELVKQLDQEFKLINKDRPKLLPQSKTFALAYAKKVVESEKGATYFDSTAKAEVKAEPYVSAAKNLI